MHLFVLVGLPAWYSILKCTTCGALEDSTKNCMAQFHGFWLCDFPCGSLFT